MLGIHYLHAANVIIYKNIKEIKYIKGPQLSLTSSL